MNRLFFLSTLFLFSINLAFAQPEDRDTERIKEMRVAFFNEELQFTPEESDAFWPIYEDFRVERRELKKSYKMNKRMELMSDQEAALYLEQHLELEEKQLALKRQYINRLKKVISVRKIAMINRTERRFKQSLLSKIQNRRGGGGGGNRR